MTGHRNRRPSSLAPLALLLLLSLLLVGGCGGGSDSPAPPEPGRLAVTLVDVEGQPVVDAWVVLHDEEGAIERTERTDRSGQADLGEVERSRVTLTYAYAVEGETALYREIRTAVDVPVGDLRVIVDEIDDDLPLPLSDDEGLFTVTVALSEDLSGDVVDLQPAYGAFAGGITSVDLSLLPEHLQSDDRFTLLAQRKSYGEGETTGELVAWAVLYDQDVRSGDVLPLSLDREPRQVGVACSDDLVEFDLSARRKGVDYTLFFASEEEPAGPDGSGRSVPQAETLAVADLEADSYAYEAKAIREGSETAVSESRRLGEALPDRIDVTLPDYDFVAVSGDAEGLLSWTLETEGDLDLLLLSLRARQTVEEGRDVCTEWVVFMEGHEGTTSFSLPDLPDLLLGWVEDQVLRVSLTALDMEGIDGYDELLERAFGGADPDAEALWTRSGEWPARED